MRIRFATLKFTAPGSSRCHEVIVVYFNKRWLFYVYGIGGAMRPGAEVRDPRLHNFTVVGGTVNNDGTWLDEISQMLANWFLLGTTDVGPYIEIERNVLTLLDVCGSRANHHGAARNLLHRLFDGGPNAPMSARVERMRRIDNIMSNTAAFCHRAITGTSTPGSFAGLLANEPGMYWRGERYIADPFGSSQAQFFRRQDLFKRLGELFTMCFTKKARGENFDGLLADAEEILHDIDNVRVLFGSSRESERLDRMGETLQRLGSALVRVECGHFEYADNVGDVRVEDGDHEEWCQQCYEHESVTCVDNGVRMATELAFFSENHQEYYSYDIDAEEADEDEPDYEDSSRAILDYSTNVMSFLKGDQNVRSSPFGDFLIGIELEMTTGNSPQTRSGAAKEIRAQLGKDYAVIKNDGSLPTDGMEIVTAPRGLAEHIERFSAWNIDPGYRAWDTGQCGMHVHIHSRAFTEMTLGKFLMFINVDTNAAFLRKLAGRHPIKDGWAARYCAQEGREILGNPKAAIKGKTAERYRMVNTQNLSRGEAERLGLDPFHYSGRYDTVELRVFKASLKKERLLAQIEFSHAAVLFCRVASYRQLDEESFLKWLRMNVRSYPHLADWYGVRPSKVTKETGKPLAEICPDKVEGELVLPEQRPARVVRRPPLPAGLNQYLTPAQRRAAEERRLQEIARREAERLRAARELAAAIERRWDDSDEN